MTETEMVDLLHVICFIFLFLLFNSIEHIFFKIFIPTVKPSAIETFHRPSNTNNFLNTLSNKFQQIDTKFIFSQTLSTSFKTEKVIFKENQ